MPEQLGGATQDHARRFPPDGRDRSHDPLQDARRQVLAERGDVPRLAGQDDALDTMAIGEPDQALGRRLEVASPVVLDVTLVAGLGELRPAAALVVSRNLALQCDLLARPLGAQRHQPRALAVHEDDEGGRRLLQRCRERDEGRPLGHQEGVLEGNPHRQDFTQPRALAREERHTAGRLEQLLAHEGLSLRLDPLEVGLGAARS